MSIHPQYANGILAGTKRVEFRKRPIADDVTHVIVYATAPVSAVVGAFTVKAQHTQNPRTLWRHVRDVAGIAWADFIAYYADRTAGTGIAVGQVLQAPQPMCLRTQLGIDRPPQSFQYVSAETAQAALNRMSPATMS
jgi:predicted transcriptional regulator